jgi:phosphotransferase system enzyme I (PtsI)
VSPGIAFGPAFVFEREVYDMEESRIDEGEVEGELERFQSAIARSERDLKKIVAITREKVGEDSAAIFDAQRMMLHDHTMHEEVVAAIRTDRVNAAWAVHRIMDRHRQKLEASDSEYFRERASDLGDVHDRIIRHLNRGRLLSAIDEDHVVIAENLTAADMVLFSRRGILGCAMDFGGPTSHVAIMARSLNVPAVVSLHDITSSVQNGELVILDGIRGRVIVNPTETPLGRYRDRRERFGRLKEEEKELVPLAAETLDGHAISLQANLELREELVLLPEYGAAGIGLFRTEILFLMEARLSVSEAEQFRTYRSVVERMRPGPTTFRVLDLGGDKLLPVAHREQNPFLGWRGVRVLLDRPELLMPQLRAILRASAFGPTRIMVPMVTDVTEMRAVRSMLAAAMEELRRDGVAFDEDIPLGAMIEVPSAALLADRFAAECDFFSIGTNDLTQYTLAVDRGNDLVSALFRDLHPAVLRLIQSTVDAARAADIPVSVCGELANNLRAVPVLLGLGVDTLSMAPVYLPGVKRVIRAMRLDEGKELARAALDASDAEELIRRLDHWLDDHACGVSFFLEGNAANGD